MAKLQECLPHWKQTPALLIESPRLALLVSVLGCEYDDQGFALRLEVMEKLKAPERFDEREVVAHYVWNQPYLSFDKERISAPYCGYIYFSAEGLERVREVQKVLSKLRGRDSDRVDVGLFRSCFRAPEMTSLASILDCLEQDYKLEISGSLRKEWDSD